MLNKAIINLKNLRHNAKEIKKLTGGAKFCAVVKADAYGHGAPVVANEIYDLVDSFAVALVEEGIELRHAGIKKDILVLISPFREDLEKAIRYNLTLSVSDLKTAKMINCQAKKQGVKVKIHVKVNTGMNRQGVDDLDELDVLCKYITNSKHLILEGVFSHFARPENKKSRNDALSKFLLAINCVKGYNNKVIAHISASGGLLAGETLDMVRIGIMLYGYTPYPTDKVNLKPVMRVFAPVIKNRTLNKGDVALYGDKKAKSDLDLSIIRYGYADGLNRTEVCGQFNNRCMDLTAVTVKGKGGWIPVLDNADQLAKAYHTISYEILCKAGLRAQRVFRR